jgi:16S rRNA C1402 (ribose-2'-O) methylase RsmI
MKKSLATYPEPHVKAIVEALAAEDRRSTSQLLEKWILERPEVIARLNGAAK